VLVAFYHACLGFPVKDSWLDTIKAGNCDTFAGLTYSNVARYCPDSDETILGHLVQTQQNIQSTKPQSTPHTSLPPAIEAPALPADALREVFLYVYPISKLYTGDTGWFPVQARVGNQYVMIAYHTDGNLILQPAFQIKADIHCIPAFKPSWHGWLLAGFWLISISEIMRPVQTSSKSSQNCGKLRSNLCLLTCTKETKPSG
jgi:hypothetical protein